MEVPIEALHVKGEADSEETGRRYPRRLRIPPLEFWRNEKVIRKRLPGSSTVSIQAVVFNTAPRSEQAPQRNIPVQATPMIANDENEVEFACAQTDELQSKFVVLPPWRGRAQPFTYVLPAMSVCLVYVVEGSLRYAREGEEDKTVIRAGDVAQFKADQREVLLAPVGARGVGAGAKFKVFFISSAAVKAKQPRAPLQDLGSA